MREATDVAVATIAAELTAHDRPRQVILCTYDALATQITTEALEAFRFQAPRWRASAAAGVRPAASPWAAVPGAIVDMRP